MQMPPMTAFAQPSSHNFPVYYALYLTTNVRITIKMWTTFYHKAINWSCQKLLVQLFILNDAECLISQCNARNCPCNYPDRCGNQASKRCGGIRNPLDNIYKYCQTIQLLDHSSIGPRFLRRAQPVLSTSYHCICATKRIDDLSRPHKKKTIGFEDSTAVY